MILILYVPYKVTNQTKIVVRLGFPYSASDKWTKINQ